MFDSLLKLAGMLLGLDERIKKSDADRRSRLSLYFENISRCLSDIATGLKAGTDVRQACAELDGYRRNNPLNDSQSVIARVFGEDLAQELYDRLDGLARIRGGSRLILSRLQKLQKNDVYMIYFPFEPSEQADLRIDEEVLAVSIEKIEDAAGQFKALSVFVTTSGR